MSVVKVEDAAGDSVELIEVDGVRLFSFHVTPDVGARRFRNIANLSCRDDDIFLCAPVKSGTHWLWEIISMLCNGNAETITKSKHMCMLEATDDISEVPSPRVLNTHVYYTFLPREMKEKKCKIVYALRNPKDLAVSFYHHCKGLNAMKYDGKWENFLPLFLEGKLEYGDWFEYVQEWEDLFTNHKDVPIHVVFYEDLKENNLSEVSRLGKFLGIDNNDDLFERISTKCQFKNMKRDKVSPPEMDVVWKGGFRMYRKGEIGDWKNYFTVAQNEYFDKVYAERMQNSKLKFRYEYSTK